MRNMDLAPVVLFVYNRVETTIQTLSCLVANTLASKTDLFIYSDGGKDISSWRQVNLLRRYLRSISGFKTVTIVEREKNYYLERNIIEGVTDIVNRFGKIIVLEDDVCVNSYFLQYMNDALCFYERVTKVMHISSIPHVNIESEYGRRFGRFFRRGFVSN